MIQTTGGKVSFTWREFTDEFVALDEDQRYELLQMIHERVSELPYLKGDMGKYRFKKKGLFG